MEEGLFQFLSLVPGLPRVHARRLAQRFQSFATLSEAALEDILGSEGMTPDLARRVREAVQSRALTAPAEAGLYICPSCGLFVSGKTDKCPHCGVVFEAGGGGPGGGAGGPADPPGAPPLCLHCGAFNQPGATVCGTCGRSMQERIEELPSPGMEEVIPKGFLPPRRKEPLAPEVPLPEEPAEKPVEG